MEGPTPSWTVLNFDYIGIMPADALAKSFLGVSMPSLLVCVLLIDILSLPFHLNYSICADF